MADLPDLVLDQPITAVQLIKAANKAGPNVTLNVKIQNIGRQIINSPSEQDVTPPKKQITAQQPRLPNFKVKSVEDEGRLFELIHELLELLPRPKYSHLAYFVFKAIFTKYKTAYQMAKTLDLPSTTVDSWLDKWRIRE